MKTKLLCTIIFALGSLHILVAAEIRTWTDDQGRLVEAEMTGISDGKVMLKLRSGKTVPFPLDRLSAADQQYAKANSGGGGGDYLAAMEKGPVKLRSASQLSFGPSGILFIADPLAATVFAIATEDNSTGSGDDLKVEAIDQKLAAVLGTTREEILINDLAVHPTSKKVYIAISRGRGPDAVPVIARVDNSGEIEVVPLEDVRSSNARLPDAPKDAGADAKRNPRLESITDLAFFDGRVLIAGLSNEEFSSAFRAIPFPFDEVPNGTSVEIFHGAHGKFETRSPVRTFIPLNVGGDPMLLAAYTCTPLVQIPIGDLKPGAKIKGKTIAELGGGNRPLDMVVYQKGGKDYVLMANSRRGVMKITTEGIEEAESIVAKANGPSGQSYETIADWTGITQLDRWDDKNAVVLDESNKEAALLEVRALP